MNTTFRLAMLIAILTGAAMTVTPVRAAESNGSKNGSSNLLLDMRLKRYTKEMELTTDQQAKIKALLEEESKQVAKLDEDKSIAVKDRAVKIGEIQQGTYAKIKPLLTEKQSPIFEKLTAKNTRKKPAAPANP